MPNANLPNILLVAGDYDIVYGVQQALQGERLSLQRAYTHRDALYTLESSRFALALVDAAMIDRYSGERTLTALARLNREMLLIAVDLRGETSEEDRSLADEVITKLDKSVIIHAVQDVLQLARAQDGKLIEAEQRAADEALARRIDEIQTLMALSQSLTEVLELTEVLNRVVEAARRLTNADEGMILLPDDEAGQLYLRAKVGIDVEAARNFRIKTQDTLAGQVFSSGQPILIGDQGPQKVKTEYFVNSLLYVPILLKGTPIGVLGVNNKDKQDAFDLNQQELLLALASYAAIGIENARIHEESLQRARELETLVEVSQVLNSSLSLDETLPNICRQLAHVLNAHRSEIYEWDHEHNRLAAMARYHRGIWRFGQGPTLQVSQYKFLQESLKNNRALLMSENVSLTRGEKQYLDQMGVAALLIVPLAPQERMIGVLRAFYIRPTPLPSGESIQSMGHLLLEALAGILNQTEQRRGQNVFHSLDNINRILGSDWCDVSLLGNEGKTLGVHAEVGNGLWLGSLRPSLDLSKYPDLSNLIRSQAVISYNPDGSKPTAGMKALLDATGSRVLLGLPLVERGKTRGLVLLGDTERNRVFGKREQDMGRAIVGQAATALENARLVRDLELSLQELKDAQDRLVQTARLSAMGELAAVVAHQINNPLTTIVVDTELMMLQETPGSPNFDTMSAILRAGKRAAGVAKRLLSIARPERPDAVPEPIDVVDSIEGVLSLVKTHIERDGIRILDNLPNELLPPVQAVRGQLDDVWLNLLTNAHDALVGHRDAKIGIDVGYNPGDGFIQVSVWDNGPGIPENIQSEIFDPFFTTKPPGEGTGLGLHICRQVVAQAGGKIWLESQPGHGARFCVQLPARPQNNP